MYLGSWKHRKTNINLSSINFGFKVQLSIHGERGLGAAQWRCFAGTGWAPMKMMRQTKEKCPQLTETNLRYSASGLVNIQTELSHTLILLGQFEIVTIRSGLLSYDTVRSGRCVPQSRRHCCLCSQDTCKQAAFCFSHDRCNNFFLKPVPTYQTTRCRNPKKSCLIIRNLFHPQYKKMTEWVYENSFQPLEAYLT
jgi:hypothetical protein